MRKHRKFLLIWLLLMAVLLAGALIAGSPGGEEPIGETMRDAVLHDAGRISLLGWKQVNPGLISAYAVTAALLAAAALLRVLAIPRFKLSPGRLQTVLETLVELFDGMAGEAPPRLRNMLGGYLFAAGAYIFSSTLFELLGLQALTTAGRSITLPAPLSDVNAAIAMGCLTYLFILSGGVLGNGLKGAGGALKEFSLPISMSFRLFGALLSGLLVTELVYHYIALSFVLPVAVGVIFTLLHALIQSYVLTMLCSLYYSEVSQPSPPREKKRLKHGNRNKIGG